MLAPSTGGTRGAILSFMFENLHRLRRAVSGLVAEDRPGFKRLDASAARPDDGAWLKLR